MPAAPKAQRARSARAVEEGKDDSFPFFSSFICHTLASLRSKLRLVVSQELAGPLKESTQYCLKVQTFRFSSYSRALEHTSFGDL